MATLADGSTIRVRTMFYDVARGVVNVQLRHEHPDYGINDKFGDYSLDNREELDEDGEVVSVANEATDFWNACQADPDHAEAWMIQKINDDEDRPQKTADLTAETDAAGTAYLPRATR